VLDDGIEPQRTEFTATCGWRIKKVVGIRGLTDAIIVGPSLTKTKSNASQRLVEMWIKMAPQKTSLWSKKVRRSLPKLLVVLEEWSSPCWTYLLSDEGEVDSGSSAVGLVIPAGGAAPEWHYLAIPNESLTAWGRFGNTAVQLSYVFETNCRKRKDG
jgi:hypothetical protein